MSARRRLAGPSRAALPMLAMCSRRRRRRLLTRDDEIRGSGTIEMDEVDIASFVGGRLVRLSVIEGDSVRVGDTLCRARPRRDLGADVAAQAAEAERAQSQARDLQQGARPAELMIAREALRAAEADLEQARR